MAKDHTKIDNLTSTAEHEWDNTCRDITEITQLKASYDCYTAFNTDLLQTWHNYHHVDPGYPPGLNESVE